MSTAGARAKHRPAAAFAAVMVFAVSILSGCGGGPVAEPSGDELYAQAEEVYLEYREIVNGALAVIYDGPWSVGDGAYGMEPSTAGCGDGWNFSLTRTTNVDPAEQDRMRQDVADYLTEAGYEVEGMDLGSGEVTSSDVIVREQGIFSLLTVTFVNNGNVVVLADTVCRPGDHFELADMLFGDVYLAEGYLPREESPSDALFFGITPGDPQFLPSPSPSP
ncbi:hypothetical protein K0817_001735 [Microbacterium sp. HD4P20]|uniref:hypothetical protein n=1 Tax=Microbacterium sp. HD4P20 TaxID=2864874 RepID=UPI001C63FA93|nr:hypothetical protein [Microbacterium sp. HD4P20]MCP2635287.1 hypothetical protein [Microbacterium sp. HD4P20]